MRKNIVAGNWKMNTTVPEGIELAKAVVAKSAEVPADVKLIIATPFTHLYPIAEVVKGTVVSLSAENCADIVADWNVGIFDERMHEMSGVVRIGQGSFSRCASRGVSTRELPLLPM